ncbi:MAG: glycosyltransferase family A protein [Flavobacterium sp.]
MRVGFNPNKDNKTSTPIFFHQVIIPVYIPNHEGYFRNAFEILNLSLTSLIKTSHDKTYITIVNNGGCLDVIEYLDQLLKDGKIHELIHTQNIGKLNAILKGISGNNFPFITVSDTDVLFLNDWQSETYNVFEKFPKTGAVCPTPSSRSLRTYTSNIYWDLFFSEKLKIAEVVNPNALANFAVSVGNADFYNSIQLSKNLIVSDNKNKAVVGAGHFVTTYRGEVFSDFRNRYSSHKMGGGSESEFLDIPVIKAGLWRLSTADNYAYHMGNVVEPWMQEEVLKLSDLKSVVTFKLHPFKKQAFWGNFIKNKLFAKFILNKKIMKLFLIWKGLSKQEAENYLV